MSNDRTLFGTIAPTTKEVQRPGHLFTWLDMLPAQAPVYVSDFTPAHLLAWRNTWAFEDTSAAQAWNRVRGFFNFRWKQGMIGENPAAKCEPLKATKGNRTGVFTDEQYESIVKACDESDDFRFPLVSRQLLHCFLELSRWSGMDLIEMVAYGWSTVHVVTNNLTGRR